MSNARSYADGRLYRIMDFSRVVQIFETKELRFSHPSKWEDPYETSIRHQESHSMFAQCWCRTASSDAMWRIYSKDHLGVRVSTTIDQITEAVRQSADPKGFVSRFDNVEYLAINDYRARVDDIAEDLRASFAPGRAMDSLFMKREAFAHEDEWRAALHCPESPVDGAPDHVAVRVDPHALFNNILLDPRAPDQLADALAHYFKHKWNYARKVERSQLYTAPGAIEL